MVTVLHLFFGLSPVSCSDFCPPYTIHSKLSGCSLSQSIKQWSLGRQCLTCTTMENYVEPNVIWTHKIHDWATSCRNTGCMQTLLYGTALLLYFAVFYWALFKKHLCNVLMCLHNSIVIQVECHCRGELASSLDATLRRAIKFKVTQFRSLPVVKGKRTCCPAVLCGVELQSLQTV